MFTLTVHLRVKNSAQIKWTLQIALNLVSSNPHPLSLLPHPPTPTATSPPSAASARATARPSSPPIVGFFTAAHCRHLHQCTLPVYPTNHPLLMQCLISKLGSTHHRFQIEIGLVIFHFVRHHQKTPESCQGDRWDGLGWSPSLAIESGRRRPGSGSTGEAVAVGSV